MVLNKHNLCQLFKLSEHFNHFFYNDKVYWSQKNLNIFFMGMKNLQVLACTELDKN